MTPLTQTAKVTVTFFAVLLIVSGGFIYQYRYNIRKTQYTEAITGYYRSYFNREPDPEGLHHWVTLALNKYGLARVEKEGFIEAKKNGAK